MTCSTRHVFVFVIGVAIGLMAAASFAQERRSPPAGPPPEGVDKQAAPGMPGDRDPDNHPMQPGPGMPPGDDGPRHNGGPGMPKHGPDGDRGPGDRGLMPGGPMQGGPMPGGPGGGSGGGMMPPPMMLHEMQKQDPEMFKLIQEDMTLEHQARELATQYRHASGEDREKLKKQVVETVTKQFEVRQQRRSLELKRLEDELKRLRELVDRRAKAKKDLVQKRVADLIGPDVPEVEF
jgi:hypothetical protein